MAKDIFVSNIKGVPAGLLAVLVIFGIALGAAADIALSLDSLKSFREILWPFVISMVCGVLASVIAVVTIKLLKKPPSENGQQRTPLAN